MSINVEPERSEASPTVELGLDLAAQDKTAVTARLSEISRLRVLGMTYQQIADRLGYSNRDSPRRILMRHLREAAVENIGEMRALENERLDFAVARVMTVLATPDQEPSVQLRAADTLVRISQRRASLNGLDAPISVEVSQGMQAALAELQELVIGEVVQGEVVR